jgi:hypothetical protein
LNYDSLKKMVKLSRPKLRIQNFAQIADSVIEFADLTVLVGAQGTGKSLAVQWLKTAIDGAQVVAALRDDGASITDVNKVIDSIFGVGMGKAWGSTSHVFWNGKQISPGALSRRPNKRTQTAPRKPEQVFFIPAHRALLITSGWALPFHKLSRDTPVVARIFSQVLFDQFNEQEQQQLFPRKGMLKELYRAKIDDAIFHGGTVEMKEDQNQSKRLQLSHGQSNLPFMTWTAGQREFAPLLFGLYPLLAGRKEKKRPSINWVIIEEPELGLHPQALTAFLLLVLELLERNYRVVLTTHSPHILTAIWMLQRLKELSAGPEVLADAFEVKLTGFKNVAVAALSKEYAVYAMEFGDDGKVNSRDISTLDPNDDDECISGWGGLTGASSMFGSAVRRAVNAVAP